MGGLFITNAKDAFKESGTLTGTCTLFIGGVETPETIAAAKKATEDQAALNELAAKTAEIARILPDGDHSVAVAETQEACQKHFILPGARLFSDLFSSWGEWKERKASDSSEIRYILGFRGPYGNSHSGILRPDVVEAIKEGLMLSFSYTWYVELVSFDDGYTRVFVTYNEIIGGRMLALVETRSIAYSAVPSEVPEAVAA